MEIKTKIKIYIQKQPVPKAKITPHPLPFTDRNSIHQGEEFQPSKDDSSQMTLFAKNLALNSLLIGKSVDDGESMSFTRQIRPFFQGQGKTKNTVQCSVRPAGAFP